MNEAVNPVMLPTCEIDSACETSPPGGLTGRVDPQDLDEGCDARQKHPCDQQHDGANRREDHTNHVATGTEAPTIHDASRHKSLLIEPHAVSSDDGALPTNEIHTRLISEIEFHLRQYSTELHETLTKQVVALQSTLMNACAVASCSTVKHAPSNIVCSSSNAAPHRANVPSALSSDQTQRAPPRLSSNEISPTIASSTKEMFSHEDASKLALPVDGSSGRSFCDVVPKQRSESKPGADCMPPGRTSPDRNKSQFMEMLSTKRASCIVQRRDTRIKSCISIRRSEVSETAEESSSRSKHSSFEPFDDARHSRLNLPPSSARNSTRNSNASNLQGSFSSHSLVRALQSVVTTVTSAGSFFSTSNKSSSKVSPQDVQFTGLESDEHTEFASFPLLEMWLARDDAIQTESSCLGTQHTRKFQSTSRASVAAGHDHAPTVQHRTIRLMVSPASLKRVIWDMLSAFCIAYDGFTTPLYFFELSSSTFIVAMRWFTRLFWTFDIPANLVTGFHTLEGDIDMEWRHVLRRYMKTWMLADVLVVAFDWLDVFLAAGDYAAGGNAARLSKTVRIIRLVRMIRLMRVGRLPQIFDRLSEYMPLQVGFFVRAAATVLKIMGIILLLAHCIACMWYAVAKDDPTSDNWIQHNSLENRSKIYLYLTAFHWSLTQFSGSMEINPRNWRERLVAVITLLFSFMVSNIFVSSLTSSMTRFHLATSRQTKMFQELRRFLERKRITPALANRVSRNALFAYKEEQKSFEEQDIDLLKLISEPLRMELHLEIHSPVLKRHPLFAHQSNANPGILRKICHTAVFVQHKMPGDILFSFYDDTEADSSLDMIFVTSGILEYRTAYTGGVQMVSPGSWICEPKLWIEWCYFGELRATETVQVLTLSPKVLHQIVTSQRAKQFFSYAASFQREMANIPLDEITDIGSEAQVKNVLNDAGLTTRRNLAASAWSTGQ